MIEYEIIPEYVKCKFEDIWSGTGDPEKWRQYINVICVIGWIHFSKGQENPEFCASGSFGSFPYIPVVGSGTSGNRPVGPEILSLSF